MEAIAVSVLEEPFAICKLPPDGAIPDWAHAGPVYSVTATKMERIVVCEARGVPAGVRADRNWRCLTVRGPSAGSLTHVLAAVAGPLAQAGISILAFGGLPAAHVLVRQQDVPRAVESLIRAGHQVVP